MFGKNPIRKPVTGDGSSLEITSIFATLQGEGIYAGWPAIFIRLGGCNLACGFCDTEFEAFEALKLEEILAQVDALYTNQELIVVTGGEPFRQPVEALCTALLARGFKVQIETNGTLFRDVPAGVDIICSPKTHASLRPDLLDRVSALKFIISASDPDYNHVPEVGQTAAKKPVYVQPMDEYDVSKNMRNVEYTRDLALENGYRLSLQLHKIIGVE